MEKIKDIKSPFMCYCAKVIPLAFDESMSYYECLCNFYNYLKNEVMPVINNNADATKELQDLFIELENYVNHYFDNLDIQEEINNKLDDIQASCCYLSWGRLLGCRREEGRCWQRSWKSPSCTVPASERVKAKKGTKLMVL